MFQSTWRHAARTRPCPHKAPSPSTPITASFSSRTHQRRHSSSKPPIPPNDGSRNIPAASVKNVGAPRSKQHAGEQTPGSDNPIPKRKLPRQKADSKQDAENEWTKNLPSVPSTQHVDPKDMALAAFFALHRPMSVHAFVPQSASIDAIDSIFAPKKQNSRSKTGVSEVMYTLASAVQGLEGHLSQQNDQQNSSDPSDITEALTQHHNQQSSSADQNQPQHLDGQPNQTQIRVPAGVQLMIQEFTRNVRPYNVPPVPVPMSDTQFESREAEAAAAEAGEEALAQALEQQIETQDQEQETSKTGRVKLSVHENRDMKSRKFFTHRAPKLRIEDLDNIQSRLEELAKAQHVEAPSTYPRRKDYSARRERQLWRYNIYAISTKRQRRLKMKKHKYKKLMRKTRNLRRRQDKL